MAIDELLDQIDKTTEAFVQTFGHLSTEELNWKPDASTWSIAQNISHLIIINESYYPVLEELKKKSLKLPWVAKWNAAVSFFGKMILKGVQPDRKRKMKTFKMWEPSSSDIPEGILDRFIEHHKELKELIQSSQNEVANKAVIYSPANSNIVYRLSTAFEIIVTHELRHFAQAKEVLALMDSSKA